MLSIVQPTKEGGASVKASANPRTHLMVRARIQGDIERAFPRAKVFTTRQTDYRYRAFITRAAVAKRLAELVETIAYTNFKDSIPDTDRKRHDAYMRVWQVMLQGQPRDPIKSSFDDDYYWDYIKNAWIRR